MYSYIFIVSSLSGFDPRSYNVMFSEALNTVFITELFEVPNIYFYFYK
jgi:hypothetical protein